MASFGDKLRRAREKKSISLDQIAEGTKIGVRYLRALEENDFAPLPGGVFDRGYVKAYAQAVGLDPQATVDAYLEERGAQTDQAERDEHTLEALHKAADLQSGGAAETWSRLSIPAGIRNGSIAVVVLAVISLSVWGVAGLIRSQPESVAAAGPEIASAEAIPISQSTAEPEAASAAPEKLPDEDKATPLAPTPVIEEAAPEPAVVEPEPTPEVATTRPPVTKPARDPARIQVRIVLDRAVNGSINCDNRRVEVLDGMRPGAVLELSCNRFVLLNVPDGGGLRIGLNGKTPTALVADGERLDRYGIYP